MSKILILGDICPDNNFRQLFDDKKVLSSTIVDDLKNADLVIANLECPATCSILTINKTGPSIKALPKDITYLKRVGVDVLALANNHVLDYGEVGLKETLSACKLNNVKVFGAGQNISEAKKPLVIDVNGCKVGLLGYAEEEFNLAGKDSAGANHFDPYESLDEVQIMKSKVDYLIVLYHGGVEYYRYPSPILQKKCRKIAEKGADLVLVQHSHCIGTAERFNGSTIVYGQGNSIFGYRKNDPSWNEGFVIELSLEKKEVKYRLLNATLSGIRYATLHQEQQRIHQFEKESAKLTDVDFLNRSWIQFSDEIKPLHLPSLYGNNKLFIHLNRLLNNKLIDLFYSKYQKMVTMELFRCEAHHEVIKTIFEQELKGYIKCPKSR